MDLYDRATLAKEYILSKIKTAPDAATSKAVSSEAEMTASQNVSVCVQYITHSFGIARKIYCKGEN